MYKLLKDPLGNEIAAVEQVSPFLLIPFDPANTDYQAYLKWLEEGNTPLPAENT
jgi:hypothetical protein